jgi:hypothetical protein
MTNADNPSHGTDWWTMDADGSNAQRLSNFNNDDGATDIGAFGGSPVWATPFRLKTGVPTSTISSATWRRTC